MGPPEEQPGLLPTEPSLQVLCFVKTLLIMVTCHLSAFTFIIAIAFAGVHLGLRSSTK